MASIGGEGSDAGGDGDKLPRLLDQVRYRMRRLGMAKRREEVYVGWHIHVRDRFTPTTSTAVATAC